MKHYNVNYLKELTLLNANNNDSCFVQETQITYIMKNGMWIEQKENQSLSLLDDFIENLENTPMILDLDENESISIKNKLLEKLRTSMNNKSDRGNLSKWLDKLNK